jgi:hypothetical protein
MPCRQCGFYDRIDRGIGRNRQDFFLGMNTERTRQRQSQNNQSQHDLSLAEWMQGGL